MTNNKNFKGFTLIELAIALVVIALLVGGVLAGQEVLTATKRNKILSEVSVLRTAITNFRAKYYRELPGDFEKAEDFWTATITADGDGDGRIDKTISTPGESLLVWEHLSLAQMLPGNYSGAMNGDDEMEVETNVPGSDYSKDLGYNMLYANDSALTDIASAWPFFEKNVITAGGCSAQASNSVEFCGGGILSPKDAHSLDVKIDDGVANQGKFAAFNDFTGDYSEDCSNDIDGGADYSLGNDEKSCVLVFSFKDFN